MVRFHLETLLAQAVQHLEGIERRFRNAAGRNETESTVERPPNDSLFLEYIGERPVGHHVRKPIAPAQRVREPRAHEQGVGDFRLIEIGGVVLAPDDGHIGPGRGVHFVANLLRGAAHHVCAGNVLMGCEYVFGGVVGVYMGRDKIERYVSVGTMADECPDPSRLRSGRPADTQSGIDRFERLRGVIVQGPVRLLRGSAGPEVQVGLVPDLEIPLRDFVNPIAIDHVRSEGRDQRVPPGVVPRWRDDRVVFEAMHDLARCELSRHER